MLGRPSLRSVRFAAPRLTLLTAFTLFAAAACSGDELGDDDTASQGGSTASAGSGGSASGSGGSSMATASNGGRSQTGGTGGSQGSSGSASMPPMMSGPVEGETGVFVGVTAAHNAV